MTLATELLRFLGIAGCIYLFFWAAHNFPITLTIKHDVVKADVKEPVDPGFLEAFEREAKKQQVLS